MQILIVDRQPKVRFALSTLLKQIPGVEIVGESATAEETLAQVELTQPDLVLLHWRLNGSTSEWLMPKLRALRPGLGIVALSARPELRSEAVDAGVDAFVCKMDQPEHLLQIIRSFSTTGQMAHAEQSEGATMSGPDREPRTPSSFASVGAYIAAASQVA